MKRWRWLFAAVLLMPLMSNAIAETITWTWSPTWADNTAVSAADQAKMKAYLRIWRGTDPKAVPANPSYFGEVKNGGTSWGVAGDNTYIMTRANAWGMTPPLLPGDNVIVSVSAAFMDNGVELDSWTRFKPGMAIAYQIPAPWPTATFTAAPTTIVSGSCSTLTWSSTNATVASIDQGVGIVATAGTKSVCPTATTTYVLMAMGAGGTEVKGVTITVTAPVQPGCNPPANLAIKP